MNISESEETELVENNDAVSIRTSQVGSQKEAGKAMKENRRFNLVTVDKEWDPTSDSPRDIAKWI